METQQEPAPTARIIRLDVGPRFFTSRPIPEDQVVHRERGVFLVLGRYPAETPDSRLVHRIQGRLTPSEFYDHIGVRATGPCMPDDISDHLVRAFDSDLARVLGWSPALFAYVAENGHTIEQHST